MTSMTRLGEGVKGREASYGLQPSPHPAITVSLASLGQPAVDRMVGTLGKYIQYCNFLDSQNNPVFHIVDDMIIPAARPGPDQPSLECGVVAAQ